MVGVAQIYCEVIAALLGLLSQIDEIGFYEPDTTVFEEIAMLFEGIGRAAQSGAATIRKIIDTTHCTPPRARRTQQAGDGREIDRQVGRRSAQPAKIRSSATTK